MAAASNNPTPPDLARTFAIDAAQLARDFSLSDVAVLDVRHISPVTDYFVIATGSSVRQMRSVMSRIEELGLPRRFRPLGRDGTDALEGESNWLLTDFVEVIVHFFTSEGRSYYDLDGLWGDGERVEWAHAVTGSSAERQIQRGPRAAEPAQR